MVEFFKNVRVKGGKDERSNSIVHPYTAYQVPEKLILETIIRVVMI